MEYLVPIIIGFFSIVTTLLIGWQITLTLHHQKIMESYHKEIKKDRESQKFYNDLLLNLGKQVAIDKIRQLSNIQELLKDKNFTVTCEKMPTIEDYSYEMLVSSNQIEDAIHGKYFRYKVDLKNNIAYKIELI